MAVAPKLDQRRVTRGNGIRLRVKFYEGDVADDRPVDFTALGWHTWTAHLVRGGREAELAVELAEPEAGSVHIVLTPAASELLDLGAWTWRLRCAEATPSPIRATGSLLVLED